MGDEKGEGYDLRAVRDLLVAAYTTETLPRSLLYSEHPSLQAFYNEFAPGMGLDAMVEKLIVDAHKKGLLGRLLWQVAEDSPKQYARFAPQLSRVSRPAPSAHDRWEQPAAQDTPTTGAFSKSEWVKSFHYVEIGIRQLQAREYPPEAIRAFRVIYNELVTNAIEHGCRHHDDRVQIEITPDFTYFQLTVLNPEGHSFDLETTLETQRSLFASSSHHRRGRGLLVVEELADVLQSTPNQEGVQAAIFRDRVRFEVRTHKERDIVVITLAQGLFNPSCGRRLLRLASRHLGSNLLLDFLSWDPGDATAPLSIVLKLAELYRATDKRVVALVPQDSLVILPDAIVARSWSEADRKIFHPEPGDNRPDPKHVEIARLIERIEASS